MTQPYLTALTPRVLWSPADSVRDRPILGALLGQRGALIVDTGASAKHAAQFLSALQGWAAPAPRFAALTHWHWDHVFGTAAMNLPTIAHVETRRRVQAMARLDWRDAALDARVAAGQELAFIADHMKVELSNAERAALVIAPPDMTFTDQVELDLGGLTAQIIHFGGDHSPDSSVICVPEERVAFLGDCLGEGFIGEGRFYTLARLFPLLDALEALPVDYYLHSHDSGPMTRAEFVKEVTMIRAVGELFEKTGGDGDAVLARLRASLGEPLDEDYVDILNALLRGLEPDVAEGAY